MLFSPLPISHCLKGSKEGLECLPEVNAIHQVLMCNEIKMMWVLLTLWYNAPLAIMIDSQTTLREKCNIFSKAEKNLSMSTLHIISLSALLIKVSAVSYMCSVSAS